MDAMKVARFAGFCGTFHKGSLESRAWRWTSTVLAGLTILFAMSAAAQSPAPPVLNTPYVCANGLSYTVTVCKPYGANQMCQYSQFQNGNHGYDAVTLWTQMTGLLKGCTVTPAPASPASPTAPPAPSSTQQTFNPPYLKEFPTVDQIMAQVKGSSAQDTANRQLSALHEFGQLIGALAGPRLQANQMTPDEVRMLTAYFNAYTAFAKSPANPQDSYLGQTNFTAYLFQTFPMPDIQKLWETSMNQASAQVPPGATPLAATTDPGTLAARRCVELGGSMTQCTGTALSVGMKSLIGLGPDALTSPGGTGLVMFGVYNAAGGLHFTFGDGSVDIAGCGQMVQGGHKYVIQPSGSQYQIKIDNQPQPLVVTLGPDGKIAAPAVQQITGQKIVGYFVETNRKTGASTRTPNYGPDTETCKVGTLLPGPATAPDQGMMADLAGVLDMMPSLFGGDPGGSTSKQLLIAPGPRMVGTYTGAGGLKIQFSDAAAVIDCAQAHVMAPYDVSNQAGTATIAVKNGTSPIGLVLQASGTLTGSGSATVNGKLMSALDADGNPVLTPTSASCAVGAMNAAK